MTRTDANLHLQAIYGSPSQAGFGSAVFCERVARAEDLGAAALKQYRHFVGAHWERFGEEAWMSGWQQIYVRQADDRRGILTELRGLTDREARSSVELLLDNIDDAAAGQKALSAVYDDPTVETLQVYTLGDGAAMSGLLIAGRDRGGDATFLVFLLD